MVDGFTIMMEVAKAKAEGKNPTGVKISEGVYDSINSVERKSKGGSFMDIDKPGHYCGVALSLNADNDKDYEIVYD